MTCAAGQVCRRRTICAAMGSHQRHRRDQQSWKVVISETVPFEELFTRNSPANRLRSSVASALFCVAKRLAEKAGLASESAGTQPLHPAMHGRECSAWPDFRARYPYGTSPLAELDQTALCAALAGDECEGNDRTDGSSAWAKAAGFAVLATRRRQEP